MTYAEEVSAAQEMAYNHGAEASIDQLTRLSTQMEALLTTITGNGHESFARYSNEVQHNVLWMAHGLAHQICIVAKKLGG